jgi:hypothetical protein
LSSHHIYNHSTGVVSLIIGIEDHPNDDLKIIQAFLAKEENPIDDLKIVWEQRCILSGCFSAFWLCVVGSGPCLVFQIHPQISLWKRRFPITSKYRHIYGVLNVDEIKKLIAQFGCTLRDERFEPN